MQAKAIKQLQHEEYALVDKMETIAQKSDNLGSIIKSTYVRDAEESTENVCESNRNQFSCHHRLNIVR